MITPSYGLTATERVLPRLALDFTTAILDPRVTFTRTGNTATVTNSSGVIVGINADLPRFDFDPTTLVCKGLLIEEARTNSLLNSLLDGTDLATQTVVVTAAARTLSFYGNGTIVLSGAHSATVNGAGAYPARTTLTFTPSVGALILTVTGTVQFAQLELGAFATSFIPTAGAAVTRNADVATMTGTNFSDWYNASGGAITVEATQDIVTNNATIVAEINNNTFNERIFITLDSPSGAGTRRSQFAVFAGGFAQAQILNGSTYGTTGKAVGAYILNNFATAQNGAAVGTDLSGTVPTVDRMYIGCRTSNSVCLNGVVRKISYYPQRLINAEVQAFSK